MKKLFKNIDTLDYYIDDKKYVIRNFFGFNEIYDAIEKYQDDSTYYTIHNVSDGEKWETISKAYYDDAEQFWVLVLLNGYTDIFYDFILSIPELENSTHFYDQENKISTALFGETVDSNNLKRNIKILKSEYISDFEFDVFNSINN